MRILVNSGSAGGGRAGGSRRVSTNPLVNFANRAGRFLTSARGNRIVSQIANAIQGLFR